MCIYRTDESDIDSSIKASMKLSLEDVTDKISSSNRRHRVVLA